MKRVIKILFGIYILFLIYVLFLNGIRTGKIGIAEYGVMSKEHLQMCNFIPLRTVINYIVLLRQNNINIDIVVKNLIGNFILFVPMSFFAQILFRKNSKLQRKAFITNFISRNYTIYYMFGFTRCR